MDLHNPSGPQERFRTYAADLASVLAHADRVRPFEDYCIGLLSTEGRKSVEPLAATTAPERTAAQHQSLLHFDAGSGASRRCLADGHLARREQHAIDLTVCRWRVRPAHDDALCFRHYIDQLPISS
jgi:hypothetical protein